MREDEADRDGSEAELVSEGVPAALACWRCFVFFEYQVGRSPGVCQEIEAAASIESRDCLLL